MDKTHDPYYIPQAVSFDILKKVLGYCFSMQNRSKPVTVETLLGVDMGVKNTIKNAIQCLKT